MESVLPRAEAAADAKAGGGSLPEIYGRHADTLYRLCFSLTGNRADAEDAVSSAFVRLMESGKTFSEAEHEKAWLIVTACNCCRDLHRQWWRKKVVPLDFQAEAAAAGTEKDGELTACLMKLPAKYRELLYLHYYEGYKLAEIAAMLGLNLNTVKTRIRSAKKQLKMEMEDDFDE